MEKSSRVLLAASFAWMAILPCASLARAADVHVDRDNTTGVANGSTLRPHPTIQAGLDAASAGDSVLVAQGAYEENVRIEDKSITLRGGYAGGSPAGYAANQPGDFTVQLPAANVTTIEAQSGDAPTILLIFKGADASLVDGFSIRGGNHGIEIDDSFSFPDVLVGITISRDVIEQNGVTGDSGHRGGGLLLTGADHVIEDNVIRDNLGGRGAGAVVCCEDIVFRRNRVEQNDGFDDHGGGIFLFGTALLEENVITGNRCCQGFDYGWGGGILIVNEGTSATLRRNVITENSAPSSGGGVFVDEGATALLDHELIFGNSALFGAGLYLDGGGLSGGGSLADVRHCTISENTSTNDPPLAGAVYVEGASSVTLWNTIAWGNGGDDFGLGDGASTIAATYTLSEEAIAGTGNLVADPLFADAAGGDFHVRSVTGRFDPAANGGAGGYVQDAQTSPAIDAGDPAAAFAAEPPPNGGRANLGAYGNTAEASLSVPEPATGAATAAAASVLFAAASARRKPRAP